MPDVEHPPRGALPIRTAPREPSRGLLRRSRAMPSIEAAAGAFRRILGGAAHLFVRAQCDAAEAPRRLSYGDPAWPPQPTSIDHAGEGGKGR
eukprot:13892952-Alexandrium_andersonii.AAC.1